MATFSGWGLESTQYPLENLVFGELPNKRSVSKKRSAARIKMHIGRPPIFVHEARGGGFARQRRLSNSETNE